VSLDPFWVSLDLVRRVLLVLLTDPRREHAGPRRPLGARPRSRGGVGRSHKVARALLLAPALVQFELARRLVRGGSRREGRRPRRNKVPTGGEIGWLHQRGPGRTVLLLWRKCHGKQRWTRLVPLPGPHVRPVGRHAAVQRHPAAGGTRRCTIASRHAAAAAAQRCTERD